MIIPTIARGLLFIHQISIEQKTLEHTDDIPCASGCICSPWTCIQSSSGRKFFEVEDIREVQCADLNEFTACSEES